MLFDDEEQVEVRHVISLAYHEVSIYSGGDKTPEGELFIKRNALCLSRRQDGPDLGPDSQVSKPFYLFSENCSAKEDFYFALLKNQEQTFRADQKVPSPLQFDVKTIISLVQRLHSTEDNIHSRWFNAMLGRVFLGVYKTRDIENLIREKLTKKISRVKRPAFLTDIAIQGINTGEAAPYFTNMKLKDLTVEGECVIEADVKYTGNARVEVAATAKIDLGTRFKAREVNLVLAVVMKKAEGHVLFKIKPPPSNRVWISFQTMPKMEMTIEPIVSSRQITYTVILRQIENRIKEVIAETVVQPFWDDIPFFKTEHKTWRGGIFKGDDATVPSDNVETAKAMAGDVTSVHRIEENSDMNAQTRPMEKSHTIPVMESQQATTGLFGRRLGRHANSSATSASSTSVESKESSAPQQVPPRSPNIAKTTTEPIVETDAAHADIFKPSSSPPDQATNFMAALQSRSQDASREETPSGSPPKPSSATQDSSRSPSPPSKEASDNDSSEDRDTTPQGRRNTTSSVESDKMSTTSSTSTKEAQKAQTGSLGRTFFLRRENSDASLSATSANSDASHKRNTLAAVTNAAVQARQWGWNAIQRQREARKHPEHPNGLDLSQPMGRGQPLPPPGTPLPGPNGKFNPIGVPTRKPVPTVQTPQSSTTNESTEHEHPADHKHHHHPHLHHHHEQHSTPPPPLPSRRRRNQSYDHTNEPIENMLVVAAPDDSQPATPVTEDRNKAWIVDTSREQTPQDSEASREPSDLTQGTSIGTSIAADEIESSGPVKLKAPAESTPTKSPASKSPMAKSPAASPVIDDDDDYSPWMEDDPLEEIEEKQKAPGPVPQEVN